MIQSLTHLLDQGGTCLLKYNAFSAISIFLGKRTLDSAATKGAGSIPATDLHILISRAVCPFALFPYPAGDNMRVVKLDFVLTRRLVQYGNYFLLYPLANSFSRDSSSHVSSNFGDFHSVQDILKYLPEFSLIAISYRQFLGHLT